MYICSVYSDKYVFSYIIYLRVLFVGLVSSYRQVRDLHRRHAASISLADLVTLAATEAGNEGIKAASM